MIVNGMIVTSLDKTIKGQVLNYDLDDDFAMVYNWLDKEFVESTLSNLVEYDLYEPINQHSSIDSCLVVWTQVPDFTNTFTTTQEVHEQK